MQANLDPTLILLHVPKKYINIIYRLAGGRNYHKYIYTRGWHHIFVWESIALYISDHYIYIYILNLLCTSQTSVGASPRAHQKNLKDTHAMVMFVFWKPQRRKTLGSHKHYPIARNQSMAFIFRFPLVPKGLIVVRERASGSARCHQHNRLPFMASSYHCHSSIAFFFFFFFFVYNIIVFIPCR